MTPLLAQAVAEGQAASALMSQPGYWAVAVGMLQSPEDFVGRVEVEKNRFVGHVVCLAEGHLVDPSVDQLSRPLKGLHIDEPLVADYDGRRVVVGFNRRGSVVKYVLHPDVPVPAPRTDRKLERMAIALAREWAVA